MSATATNLLFVPRPMPALPGSELSAAAAWVISLLKAWQTRRLVERLDNHIRVDIGLGPAPMRQPSGAEQTLVSHLIAMR